MAKLPEIKPPKPVKPEYEAHIEAVPHWASGTLQPDKDALATYVEHCYSEGWRLVAIIPASPPICVFERPLK